jgi:hypothetical protein
MEKPLDYLFTAILADETVFCQPVDDHSELDPERRTAFYDLLELSKDNPVKYFAISNGKDTLAVDLVTGNFALNGVEMMSQSDVPQIEDPEYKLIYHRTMRRRFNVDTHDESVECLGHFIGWEVSVKKVKNGKEHIKTYKQILGLK